MTSSSRSWWMLSVGVLVCMWTQGARAESCEQSSDCPKGYMCQEFQSGACAGAAPCAEGQMCPAPPPCEVVTQHECVPGACSSDADCADFMVCYESSISVCSGGAAEPAVDCPPNQTCPTAKPMPMAPECTEQKQKQCTPRYVLPCQADADCGAGFSCEANEECMCSGSAGRGAAEPAPTASTDAGTASSGASPAFAPVQPQDAGVDVVVVEKDAGAPVCECHPSAVKYCRVKEVKCQADADCPSNFACFTFASGSGSASCDAPRGADGGACVTTQTKTVEEKRCQPKYDGGGVSLGSKDSSTQAPMAGGATGTTTTGGNGTALPVPSTDSRHSSADAGAESAGAIEPSSDKTSCSVHAPGARGRDAAGYALGFVLLALNLRRRRQR